MFLVFLQSIPDSTPAEAVGAEEVHPGAAGVEVLLVAAVDTEAEVQVARVEVQAEVPVVGTVEALLVAVVATEGEPLAEAGAAVEPQLAAPPRA